MTKFLNGHVSTISLGKPYWLVKIAIQSTYTQTVPLRKVNPSPAFSYKRANWKIKE